MARRQHLTEAQIAELFDPPTEQRDLVRHYMLSAADLAAIQRCRGDHNRLGHAMMLCYLRYPGRPLRSAEQPPRPMLEFVADQIDVLPGSVDSYLAVDRNRRIHSFRPSLAACRQASRQRHWPGCLVIVTVARRWQGANRS